MGHGAGRKVKNFWSRRVLVTAVAAFVAIVGFEVALVAGSQGYDTPTKVKLNAILHQASPEAAELLWRDHYAKFLFTNPAEIFDAQPRGVSFEDKTRIHVAFLPPDPADRVDCDAISKDGLAVVLIAGQSNAENTTRADDLYSPKSRFYNLNIEDGGCYVARQRAIGTTGHGSAFALPLADDLLAKGLFRNVLIVPIAVGGTYIEEWRPDGGRYFPRFRKAVQELARHGLEATFVLWQQGEGNAALFRGMTLGLFGDSTNYRPVNPTPALLEAAKLNYQARFYAIAGALRQLGVSAPIFPTISTICGYPRVDATIRAAQLALPDPELGIYAGPDTDEVDFSTRYDACHFDSRGIQIVAQAWTERLTDYLARRRGRALAAARSDHH